MNVRNDIWRKESRGHQKQKQAKGDEILRCDLSLGFIVFSFFFYYYLLPFISFVIRTKFQLNFVRMKWRMGHGWTVAKAVHTKPQLQPMTMAGIYTLFSSLFFIIYYLLLLCMRGVHARISLRG